MEGKLANLSLRKWLPGFRQASACQTNATLHDNTTAICPSSRHNTEITAQEYASQLSEKIARAPINTKSSGWLPDKLLSVRSASQKDKNRILSDEIHNFIARANAQGMRPEALGFQVGSLSRINRQHEKSEHGKRALDRSIQHILDSTQTAGGGKDHAKYQEGMRCGYHMLPGFLRTIYKLKLAMQQFYDTYINMPFQWVVHFASDLLRPAASKAACPPTPR